MFLGAQLLRFFSVRLEVAILDAVKGGSSPSALVKVRVSALVELLWNNQRLSQELRKYFFNCKLATRTATNFTLASDKANVGGPSLQNTLLVLPDGVALALPPQALPYYS